MILRAQLAAIMIAAGALHAQQPPANAGRGAARVP